MLTLCANVVLHFIFCYFDPLTSNHKTMDEVKPKGLTFPEGLDEAKVDGLLQEILDGIDRGRLFYDQRLTRVRHPLLEERMGRDTALNTEIHNLLTDIVTALSVSDRISNRDELLAGIPQVESILLDSAHNPETLRENLTALKDAVTQLAELNPEEDGEEVEGLVSRQLRQKLTMPNTAQQLVLYPPVTMTSLGESTDSVLKTLEGCKTHLLKALEGKEDDDSKELREAVEAEAAAVRAWFEKTAA